MFGRHEKTNRAPASGPHPFVEPSDARMGLALGGPLSLEAPTAMTSLVAAHSLGRDRCASPGCGKSREDPLHWPAEP
jgi:hypothetical protein